ncbi:unnamed protein product, partial [Oppiella nova]
MSSQPLVSRLTQSWINERDKHPNRLHVLQLEGTNYNSFPQFVKQVEAIVGDQGLDTLINNAGMGVPGSLDSVTAEDMLKNFEVNSVAPLMLTKALLPLLKVSAARGKTSVINISSSIGSMSVEVPEIYTREIYPYCTSKAALNMITKRLSVDLKPHGIHVISICPGHLKTDMGGPNGAEVSTGVSGANRGIGLELVRQVLTTTHAKHVIATTRQSSHPELDQLRDKHPNRLHVLQ